jgi:hypothetical protein
VLKPELSEDDVEVFKSCILNLVAENTELNVLVLLSSVVECLEFVLHQTKLDVQLFILV